MRLFRFATVLIAGVPVDLASAQVSPSQPLQPKTTVAKSAPGAGGALTPQLVTFAVGGNNDCSTASTSDAITGYGSFALNTTGATTGSPLGSCGAIGTDVWFYWTAPATGLTTVSTCGQVTADSVIAVWNDGSPAGSCPTSQIICLDDFCGLQTQVAFAATAGASYFLEFGSYASGAGYNGTFTINPPPPPVANDSCLSPDNLVGDGPHAFNTVGATTGTEGQVESLCLFFGFTNIYNDAWYTWTASTSGQYEASLCTNTTHPDTRLAVYSGTGCPADGSAIACNDDSCGLLSAVCFSATAGQVYTIQIGSYSSGQGGQGNLQFTPQTGGVTPCGDQDDGTTENSVGLTAGGAVAWMTGFGAGATSTTISSIETCFGTPLFPGGYVPQGPVTVAVWDDPNDDGNPTDAVLLGTASSAVSPGSIDTDVFQSIPLGTSITVNGLFFVGAVVVHSSGQYPGPLDQSSSGGGPCGGGGNPGSWIAGNTSGTFNFTNLAANDVAPLDMDQIGLPGDWLLRVTCASGGATPYCFGDGSGTACPCGNSGAAGNGCGNSVHPAGANLSVTGNAVVGADTLVLTGSLMPNISTVLYFQGTARNSAVFGDGLSCVGGSMIRLGTKTNSSGSSSYPVAGDASISVRGLVSAGDTRQYQGWYRDADAFCTAFTFNLTNGVEVVWQ